jgi:hypothetical protein
MIIFSKVHNWQGDDAVKQIHVFSCAAAITSFDDKFDDRVADVGISSASDTGIGAIYKLRAVRDGFNRWIPLIRCGFTGICLWEECNTYADSKSALDVCIQHLKNSILKACQKSMTAKPLDAEELDELYQLREAVKGPDGFATWQAAATDERVRRVKAETALTNSVSRGDFDTVITDLNTAKALLQELAPTMTKQQLELVGRRTGSFFPVIVD